MSTDVTLEAHLQDGSFKKLCNVSPLYCLREYNEQCVRKRVMVLIVAKLSIHLTKGLRN